MILTGIKTRQSSPPEEAHRFTDAEVSLFNCLWFMPVKNYYSMIYTGSRKSFFSSHSQEIHSYPRRHLNSKMHCE